jgi:hypothetical protein
MSSKPARDLKRKPTKIRKSVSKNDDRNLPVVREESRKIRRVSMNASASTATSLQVDTPVPTQIVAASATTKHEEPIQIIGKMIRDLSSYDNAQVNAALVALGLDLSEDKKKRDRLQAIGGCVALVQLMKNCLEKAIDRVPVCEQVTDLNEIPELRTLHKTLIVIIILTYWRFESRVVGITAIGGVEVVVKILKTFPKCEALQKGACFVLGNLGDINVTGKKNIIESGGIETLLSAANNHFNSADVCESVCWALSKIAFRHYESKARFTAIGGVEVVVKVMKTFPRSQALQEGACASLVNLTCCSIGLAKAVESGGIKMLLAAVNNHLGSLYICKHACWALSKIVRGSKENTGLLITLGGATSVAKVRTKWPNDDYVQTKVQRLAQLIGTEMNSWAVKEPKCARFSRCHHCGKCQNQVAGQRLCPN